MEEDIEEQFNIAEKFPSVVIELLIEAEIARSELEDWNMHGKDEHDFNGFKGNIYAIPERFR